MRAPFDGPDRMDIVLLGIYVKPSPLVRSRAGAHDEEDLAANVSAARPLRLQIDRTLRDLGQGRVGLFLFLESLIEQPRGLAQAQFVAQVFKVP